MALLDPARFESLIVSLRPRGPLSKLAEESGVEVHHLSMGQRPGPITIWRLASILRRREISIAHSYLYDAGIATRVAGRFARVPVVLTSTRASLEYLPRIAWWVDRYTARWCTRVLAVSQGTAEFVTDVEHIPAEKVRIVTNGVDSARFRPGNRSGAREAWNIPAEACVVLSIGRLHAQKGHEFLLRAICQLRDLPGLICLVVGDGPLRDALEQRAADLGIRHVCRFVASVSDPRDLYDAADVTVLASLYEGMPNVVLEAMAMGCPVVTTRVDGAVDLVHDGVTGVLVAPGDADALERAIRRVLQTPDARQSMGARARSVVEAHHGLDQMVRSLEELYEQEWGAVRKGDAHVSAP